MAPKAKLVAYHPVHGYKIKPQQDLKTIKRNERERSRVQTVNSGFETLRKHIPTAAALKKMSKVNILNEAMEYIQYLRSVLHNPTDVKSEPVLLNFTNTMYEQNMYQQYTQLIQQMYSPQGFQPPLTPTTPTCPTFSTLTVIKDFTPTSASQPRLFQPLKECINLQHGTLLDIQIQIMFIKILCHLSQRCLPQQIGYPQMFNQLAATPINTKTYPSHLVKKMTSLMR